jgi:predicted heme/steroid binding protein
MSSQLLCTYDGESHSVLREESESDSVEEVLQRVFSLVLVVWVTFWSPRRHENQGQGGQGHSQADGRSMEEEEEGAGGRAAAVDVQLGPVSSRARGLFLESVWWLLHRVSGFAFEVPPADWEALLGILDRDIPTQHCPQTMAGAAMLLSVSHARMIREEVEYNQYKESIARAVCSGVPNVFGLDVASKDEGACVCVSRWLDSKHGSGTCMCALRWAVSRCTNGIVESGALVGLLQWFPVLLASPPRLAPHVSQYSLSHKDQQQHQVHEGLQKMNPHMVDKHGHFLYERTIAVDDRAVSDVSLSFLWGAFKHLSCMTPPSTAEDLTQETLDSMTAGLKNLLTAPLIIMASGHSGMGLLGSKDDVLPPRRRDLVARDVGDRGDEMGGIDIEDVHAADGFQTHARNVEESGRSRWKLLFSWWLDLDQRLEEQRRLCALMPPPTPIFSPTSDMEMELGRGSDGDGVEIDMHTLAFTQFLSLPAPLATVGVGMGVEIGGEGAQDSPCLVAPVMQYGGVIAHGGRGRRQGRGRSPCHVDDLHASLDYITLASEALQV